MVNAKRALNFVAGPHAARAGDAGGVIEGKERIRVIAIGQPALRIVVAHRTDPTSNSQALQRLRHGTGSRLFREIQLDDVAPQPLEPFGFCLHDEPFSRRRRTGRRGPALPLDLAQAESTGPKGGEVVRRTEARDGDPGFLGSLVDRVAGLGGDALAIDRDASW